MHVHWGVTKSLRIRSHKAHLVGGLRSKGFEFDGSNDGGIRIRTRNARRFATWSDCPSCRQALMRSRLQIIQRGWKIWTQLLSHGYFSFRSIQFSEKRLVPGCQSFGQSVHLLALFSHRIVLENREMSFRAHYGIEKFTGALRLWCIRTHGRDADAKEGKSRREGTSTYTNESLTFYPAGITLLNPPLKPQYSFIV